MASTMASMIMAPMAAVKIFSGPNTKSGFTMDTITEMIQTKIRMNPIQSAIFMTLSLIIVIDILQLPCHTSFNC